MSKVFEVILGGATRRLSYAWRTARPFFKARGARPLVFLLQDCLGLVLDSRGNAVKEPATGEPKVDIRLVDDDARFELLVLGLGETPEIVEKWIDAAIVGGGTLEELASVAVKAALYAGVTGKSVDLDSKKQEAQEGKAQPTQESPA